MPLHLLGKKSWNVYNAANIARVRRDEAAAQAREEADEQRMQEADAARRLAILRGEIPPPLQGPSSQPSPDALPPSRGHHDERAGRKRKRHGEDDTDFEMRVARSRASPHAPPASKPAPSSSSAPLVDSRGHIALFSAPPQPPREPHPEAAREAARKDRELKDQYQMRLVNAAGRDGAGLTDGGPWYASAEGEVSAAAPGVTDKNVWGRDDPGRRDRAAARMGASDPLALMQKGARMVRELEKGRRREVEEREREMGEMEREERRERKRERRREERVRSRERERKRGREDDSGGRKTSRRDDCGRHRDDRRRNRSGERHRDRSEDRRRDRSGERHRDRRDRKDSPGRDDTADKRERSHRDLDDRQKDRSRERDSRRDDRHERRRDRDGNKYRHFDNSS